MADRHVIDVFSEGQFWSGYLVAPALAVTAGHGLPAGMTESTEILVRRISDQHGFRARLAWRDTALDIALLEIADDRWQPDPEFSRISWGQLPELIPVHEGYAPVACAARGFPLAQRQPNGVRAVETLAGLIHPGTGELSNQTQVQVISGDLGQVGSSSGWLGMSGAAVFCGALLVGILIEDTPDIEARLTAVPSMAFLNKPGAVAVLQRAGVDTATQVLRTPNRTGDGSRRMRVGQIPGRAAVFQSRPEQHRLTTALAGTGTVVLTQVITGMGGIGKTQLAAEYANRAWTEHAVDILIWVTARSRLHVQASYAEAARRLGIPLSGSDETDAAALLNWLADNEQPWLVILDDVQNANALADLWPDRGRCGRVIVTSRLRDVTIKDVGRVVEVGLFAHDQAMEYLTVRLADRTHVDGAAVLSKANELIDALGRLPIGLAQAAVYIALKGITCAEYLRRLSSGTLPFPDVALLPDGHALAVDATLRLSISAADALRPEALAGRVMRLACVHRANDIPASAFKSLPALRYLDGRRFALRPRIDASKVDDALSNLHTYSAVDYFEHTVRVHALVQRAVASHLTAAELRAATKVVNTTTAAVRRRTEPGTVAPPAATRSRQAVLNRRDLIRYRDAVARRSQGVRLGFADEQVGLDKIYIPPHAIADGARVDLMALTRSTPRAVILGSPGSGKSTFLRHWQSDWARHPDNYPFVPILVELHRFGVAAQSLSQLVADHLESSGVREAFSTLSEGLRMGTWCLLLDGLDEVSPLDRQRLVREIGELSLQFPRVQVIITSRLVGYLGELSSFTTIFLDEFDDDQVAAFASRWFSHAEAAGGSSEGANATAAFQLDLIRSPHLRGLARSPLLLSMLAALSTRLRGSSNLQSTRAAFIDEAVRHLLRRDRDLGVLGTVAVFDGGNKQRVLQRIALSAYESDPGFDFSRRRLHAVVSRMLPELGLDSSLAAGMIDEIVERSGLLVSVGPDGTLAFVHLIFQEYLAATELIDQPDRLLLLYRSNPPRLRDVVRIWCGATSRDSTGLVAELFQGSDEDRILALECLKEAQRIDSNIARTIVDYFLENPALSHGVNSRRIVTALGAMVADPRRGVAIFDRLAVRARDAGDLFAMSVLGATSMPEAAALLAEMSSVSPGAKVALRSMGDLLIPPAAASVENGRLDGIDDIASLRSQAAVTALTNLLRPGDAGSTAAAWHLANLIEEAGIEQWLATVTLPPDDSPLEDWVWRPFSQGRVSLDLIMGRVAYLLTDGAASLVPVDRIDARIGLVLIFITIPASDPNAAQWYQQAPPITPVEAAELDKHLSSSTQRPLWAKGPVAELLAAAPLSFDPTSADEVSYLCESIFARIELPTHVRAVLERLPLGTRGMLLLRWYRHGDLSISRREWLAAPRSSFARSLRQLVEGFVGRHLRRLRGHQPGREYPTFDTERRYRP